MLPLVLALLTAAPGAPAPKTFALVIGHNHAADDDTPDLKFADDDALAMHELLLELGAQSVLLVSPDAETKALHPDVKGLAPTAANLKAAWAQLRNELVTAAAAGPVEFMLFYSGHGDISHGEGFLALADGRLTRAMVLSMLAESPASKNHVIIDACKAYFAVLGKGAGGQRERYGQPFASGSASPERSGFLLSTSSDGDAHEWERYQSGVFSFEVRSALRGSADVDADGVITYRELGGFLQRANAGIANAKFRPDFLVVPPGGAAAGLDDAVVRWAPKPAALTLEGPATHLYVESGSGRRLLELNRASNLPFELRLPSERPLFIRSADEREERVLESSAPTAFASLPVTAVSSSRKGALQLAFRQIFSQPFDASAVESFSVDYGLRAQVRAPVSDARSVARTVTLVTAVGAGLVMLGALVVGVERSTVTSQTSQRERVARNEGLMAANVTMGIGGGLAVASLATWLVLTLTEPTPAVSFGLSPSGVSVHGRW